MENETLVAYVVGLLKTMINRTDLEERINDYGWGHFRNEEKELLNTAFDKCYSDLIYLLDNNKDYIKKIFFRTPDL
jgi:hypothetical protein